VPAYFCSLEVENVRCFADKQQLDLMHDGRPAKWTVLLGDNGVGKTTLLQCLYAMAPFKRRFDKNELYLGPHGFGENDLPSARMGREYGEVRARLRTGELIRELGTELQGDLTIHGETGSSALRYIQQVDESYVSCPCCGYGATRRIGHVGLESRGLQGSGDSLFSVEAPLINAVEWLLQADYAARGTALGSRAARNRDAIKNALIGLLPDVLAIREAGLDEIPPRPRVDVQTPYGWVSLRDLSLGYQTMIAWVVDLASRMFEAYPDSENPLSEAAVVLVDEIDLHLHPRWQREITSYLDRLFPNVQFIVTAHSPLVVQAPGVTNVAVLRRNGDHVEILNDPEEVRGWRVDQILTSDLFGLDSARPVEFERLIDRQQELVLLDDLTDAQRQELREIEAKLAKLAPGETARDREAWAVIHEMASRLHDGSGGQP
jgi:energy-coupling factor transporter ATP-binding protein EcfA2